MTMMNLDRPLLAALLLLLTILDSDSTTNLSSLLGVVEQWRPQDVRANSVQSRAIVVAWNVTAMCAKNIITSLGRASASTVIE